MQSKAKKLCLMRDFDEEEVEKVMKKVDNRNLRRISRMLIEADVKAVEEQERLKDLSMQKVFKSVETRNIRKVSKSLQVWNFSYFKKNTSNIILSELKIGDQNQMFTRLDVGYRYRPYTCSISYHDDEV